MQTELATALDRLHHFGQSVWVDDLTRQMLVHRDLEALIERGVTGVTANPTTFDKAVTGSERYDSEIRRCPLAALRRSCGSF